MFQIVISALYVGDGLWDYEIRDAAGLRLFATREEIKLTDAFYLIKDTIRAYDAFKRDQALIHGVNK